MKKILIIGAGFLQRFVIRKAKEMGYYVLAVDGNPNAIGFADADECEVINIVDQEACLAYAQEKQIDGVLTAATDYGVLTASYIAKAMGLPGLDYEVALRVKNKYAVRRCLYENNVDDSRQAYEVTGETDLDALANQLVYPVMVKPCDGSGSRGTSRIDSRELLKNACLQAMSQSITHRAEIETFIVGHEYGAESLVVNGEVHVLGIMRKWMTKPPYYAELGHAMPCGLSEVMETKVKECASKAIKALGINHGSVNMDMLITYDGRVYIIDIGARMGGNMIGPSIIPYGTGIDYMGAMLRAAVGDSVEWKQDNQRAVATKLLALKPVIVKQISDMARWESENVEILHHIQEGDVINEYHTNLDGMGYVIVSADDVVEAEMTAQRIKNEIDVSIVRL